MSDSASNAQEPTYHHPGGPPPPDGLAPANLVNPPEGDPAILRNLALYGKHRSLLCLFCGYKGMMGMVKVTVPWYLSWWVIVPLVLTGIGLVPAVLLGVIRGNAGRALVDCPNCGRRLLQTAG